MAASSRKRRRKKKRRGPGRGRARLLRLLRRSILFGLPVALVALAAAFFWIDRSVVRRFEDRTQSFPSRVYAAPYSLIRGEPMDPDALEAQLQRLGYVEVRGEPVRPGQYQRRGNDWILYLRPAATPDGPREALLVKVGAWLSAAPFS